MVIGYASLASNFNIVYMMELELRLELQVYNHMVHVHPVHRAHTQTLKLYIHQPTGM